MKRRAWEVTNLLVILLETVPTVVLPSSACPAKLFAIRNEFMVYGMTVMVNKSNLFFSEHRQIR